ncbi:hypothetical protein HWV62_39545 [Athelia sp. TMB]|nr:hypothetical protein HWV62_39545 [Athelia sp. TMB]
MTKGSKRAPGSKPSAASGVLRCSCGPESALSDALRLHKLSLSTKSGMRFTVSHSRTPSTDMASADHSESSVDDVEHGAPDLPQLFSDAARYEQLLAETRSPASSEDDEAPDVVAGFADLVGGNLTSTEEAIAGRLAKLSVTGNTWIGAGDKLESEPESYDSEDTDKDSNSDDTQTDETTPAGSEEGSGESWQISPEEAVRLMVEEFGPLAPEGEEKLVIEADGVIIGDVVVLGVIHLTTHRLAYHASLLSSRPDLAPTQQILKSGSATLHRAGWHKQRRVWLELSHDMLCSYASSRDEDRIRPLRSVLFSNVEKIHPINHLKPRVVNVKFADETNMNCGYAEFDTEESAREWRKEMSAAVFLYRRRRHDFMVNDGKVDTDGVRMSLPLSKIDHVETTSRLAFTYFFSIHLTQDADIPPEYKMKNIQMGMLRPVPEWSTFGDYIAAAKRREYSGPANVVLDFGTLSFNPNKLPERTGSTATDSIIASPDKERALRFALALGDESRIWFTKARIRRGISATGYFVVTPSLVCFWSRMAFSNDIRYRLPLSKVKSASAASSSFFQHNGLRLALDGQGDLVFDFRTAKRRDMAAHLINQASSSEALFTAALTSSPLSSGRQTPSEKASLVASPQPLTSPDAGEVDTHQLPATPTRSVTAILAPLSRALEKATTLDDPDGIRKKSTLKIINLPHGTIFGRTSLHFVCLTIGSRGDVQPYIALCKGLQEKGHRASIVTHDEYKEWIEGFGIEHRAAGGDPGALMKLSVEHKMFSPEFFKESLGHFRKWLDDLLVDSWTQCQGADVLLESPSAMAGVHIAEALNIPYFRCFTMPWTKTSAFPHAFLSPPVEAPTFNAASYVLFDNVMWTATSGQINRWRRNTMKIPSTDMSHLKQSKIPFIYNFSTAVVPKPLDWSDTTVVSGYWFLDNPDLNWTPPPTLIEWMANAKKDGKPIVYIGFGSITVPNPNEVTQTLVKAVLKSDVRAIISKGWSARMSKKSDEPEVEIPPECYQLDKVPHE